MMKYRDDVLLYERCKNGDGAALKEVIALYSDCLVYFINRYIGNITAAEELMEDTSCDMMMNRRHYRGASSLKTYLFSIARNKAADYVRRASKYCSESIEEHEEYLKDEASLEEVLIKEERKKTVWRAMNALNDDYRMLLYLIYFEELSYAETARVLKRTHGQIRNAAYRARAALKIELERGGFEYEEL